MVALEWTMGVSLDYYRNATLVIGVSNCHQSLEVYLIQHYVIKFVSHLRQVGDFLQFPPSIKLIAN